MSSRTETIRIRTWPRLPRPGWLIPGALVIVLAAGVGSYIALRSDARQASPAVTPLQPAAPPAGPQIAELRGVDVPTAAGLQPAADAGAKPAGVKGAGASGAASEWRCSPMKRGPC